MGDIKSALEIAMEKVKDIGEATEEERLQWKYVPEGERLAAGYLKEDNNLTRAVEKYGESERKYVIKGATEVLLRNINLPANDSAIRDNKKAMDGLKVLKNNKVAVENNFSKIRQLFNHYTEQGEQQRKQAYESLKMDFEAQLQQAVKQQLGTTTGIKIDVEKQPQFQQEWRKVLSQLDSQYLNLLGEYKKELSNIA